MGASWEGHVIESALATLLALGRPFEAYHFRTSYQHELDLVLDIEGELWAVEVKLTSSPSSDDMRRLDKITSYRETLIGSVEGIKLRSVSTIGARSMLTVFAYPSTPANASPR